MIRASYVIAMPVRLPWQRSTSYSRPVRCPQSRPRAWARPSPRAPAARPADLMSRTSHSTGVPKGRPRPWNNIFNPEGTGKVSSEVYNKLAPAVRLGVETLTNEDWASHPIWNPNHPMTQKIKEYIQHVGQSIMPIAGQQITQARAGTKIGPTERLLGVRPAPSFVQKPISTGEFLRGKNERDWASKMKLG